MAIMDFAQYIYILRRCKHGGVPAHMSIDVYYTSRSESTVASVALLQHPLARTLSIARFRISVRRGWLLA